MRRASTFWASPATGDLRRSSPTRLGSSRTRRERSRRSTSGSRATQPLSLDEIRSLPVAQVTREKAHLYLWCPNALLPEGLAVMMAWGFAYKSNIVWHKVRKDGGPDGRGVGFYFRNVTELILFGIKGKNARTLAPGRRQVNYLATRKREHSRKPDEQYKIIEACSPGPVFGIIRARHPQGLGHVGQSGRRCLSADVENLRASFAGQAGRGGVGADGGSSAFSNQGQVA